MENSLAQHLEHFLLGVYDGRELRSREGLTDVFIDGKFECMLLVVWLGSVDDINIGPDEGNGLENHLDVFTDSYLVNIME